MTLSAFEIPDDPTQLAQWLERHLVSLDLGTLVAELVAVHPEQPVDSTTLRDLIGQQELQSVLAQGLSVLQPNELRRLLTRPHLLLELQELVLFAGGSYWQRLSERDGAVSDSALRGEARLKAFLANWEQRKASGEQSPLLTPPPAWYQHPLVVSLATAAAVLLAVMLWNQFVQPKREQPVAPTVTAWGWSKPDALPQDVPPAEYLKTLANGAYDWFKTRPEDRAGLAKRITEFREGCTRLQLAEHRPLSEDDRKWLLERCRLWSQKLDKHLADIETSRNVTGIRGEVDDTVMKLLTALNERTSKL